MTPPHQTRRELSEKLHEAYGDYVAKLGHPGCQAHFSPSDPHRLLSAGTQLYQTPLQCPQFPPSPGCFSEKLCKQLLWFWGFLKYYFLKAEDHGSRTAEINIKLQESGNFTQSLIKGQPMWKVAKYNLHRSRRHNFLEGWWKRDMLSNLAVLSAKESL